MSGFTPRQRRALRKRLAGLVDRVEKLQSRAYDIGAPVSVTLRIGRARYALLEAHNAPALNSAQDEDAALAGYAPLGAAS